MAKHCVLVIALHCLVVYTSGKHISTYEEDNEKIVGGIEIDISKRPFQVSLRGESASTHFCGGSILNEKTVLTAAHCIDIVGDLKYLRIMAGSTYYDKGGDIYSVAKAIKHERYDKETIDFDIGILVPDKNIVFSEVVQPIKLADKDIDLQNGYKLIVSGWGRTIGGSGSSLSKHLKQANTKYVKECKIDNCTIAITDNMLCAHEKVGETSCQGDSGGPLTSSDNKILIGAVSWGEWACTGEYPAVYARISALRDWIDKNTQR